MLRGQLEPKSQHQGDLRPGDARGDHLLLLLLVSQQHPMMMMVFGGAVSRVAPRGRLNKLWVVRHPYSSLKGTWLLSCAAGVATD